MVKKGKKSPNGYGSSKMFEGKTYQEIADIMTEKGFKMKHSNVRTIYIKTLMKVADEISSLYGLEKSEKDLQDIAINPDFQDSVRGFITDIIDESSKQKKNSFPFDI